MARYFYGVYLVNHNLAAALDLIRFFAEPDYFRRTHITIRGPYTKRLGSDVERDLEKRFSDGGRELSLSGVGSFFDADKIVSQNTVILKCNLPGSEDVWYKPSFQDGKPHITLYDGPSRRFALILRNTLKKYKWDFTTKTSGIEFLESKHDPKGTFELYNDMAQRICDQLFNGDVSIRTFDLKSELERLYLVDKVSSYIHKEIVRNKKFVY